MENRWILHVRDFGKLESADVAVGSLTLFVGDNNSGKSYLMTLIYTLLNIRWYRDRYSLCTDSEEYRKCAEWIGEMLAESRRKKATATISPDRQRDLEQLLNRILQKNKERIVRNAFQTELSIGELSVTLPALGDRGEVAISRLETDAEEETYKLSVKNVREHRRHGVRIRKKEAAVLTRYFICFLLEFLLKSELKSALLDDACFLPTSRTGFLLTYRSLISASLTEEYDTGEGNAAPVPRPHLTKPCSDFLRTLVNLSPERTQDRF